MSYRNKKIIRLLQRYSHAIQEKIRFKTSHITFGGKFTIFGVCICLLSLFMPWISPLDNISKNIPSSSSFSSLLGLIGFFILGVLGIIAFSIFSIQKKEKFHFLSQIQLSDHLSAFFGSIFIFIVSLHSFLLINGLQVFSINIIYGQGVMLCITGSIIIFIGSRLMKTEYRKNIKGSYISELRSSEHVEVNEKEKNNMKLPF